MRLSDSGFAADLTSAMMRTRMNIDSKNKTGQNAVDGWAETEPAALKQAVPMFLSGPVVVLDSRLIRYNRKERHIRIILYSYRACTSASLASSPLPHSSYDATIIAMALLSLASVKLSVCICTV